jgi:LmbE family N-acetylglucosaminyl deacetylase
MMGRPVAIAVGAHPDDIEFYMAGTLLLLSEAGYETHYFNIASGNCGSSTLTSVQTKKRRALEARAAAAVLGAEFHRSLTDDLEIIYKVGLLRRIAAVIREVGPEIVLSHSPQDYMEDHTNTCRLVVTAAFARGMGNFKTTPPYGPIDRDVTVYHCMPHGLRDGLRRRVVAGQFVNTSSVHARKLEALRQHQTQQEWLAVSQGLNSYLKTMEDFSRAIGRSSGRFEHAEGWRRHSNLGFAPTERDPLSEVLGENCVTNAGYERGLDE